MSPTEETADVSQGSKAAGSGSDVQPASKGTRTQKHRKAEDYTKMFDLGINRILQTKDTRQQDDRAAAMLIPRANLREVRRELKEYHDNFVSQRLRFFEERTDMEAMVDKIIVANRFGQFGARRMQVAGVEFEEDS
ncbi:hypothetical protein GUITHDRAFT_156048 [Guillardia theta CCMP2712]|uniref:Uncharacterized protein n=1 Tax=Guillardia theta (strain CCMP2712) TaxID=905079 RepID=L1IB03_GUITC|nr:hypothetical protein GUITHDRAFT_156048 [Guillardia theta CCMP2712]EKX33436.1 hypothetical protein GUITHDRAFT_156048 [Guillardia theta CCMP2712]|eukprot:XP_005820416.1 hypothetical protein GUITHDRAFT_156048 [Guillardia theta CCMP2712]